MRFLNQKKNKKKLISDINVTPFVDVLLVLLIIFMIAAPMLTGSVEVNLPKGSSEPIQDKSEPIVLAIKSSKRIFLQDQEISQHNLEESLDKLTKNNRAEKIYIKADSTIDYGFVMQVIKEMNQAGFVQVILITDIN